jgi:hypothetical protein
LLLSQPFAANSMRQIAAVSGLNVVELGSSYTERMIDLKQENDIDDAMAFLSNYRHANTRHGEASLSILSILKFRN